LNGGKQHFDKQKLVSSRFIISFLTSLAIQWAKMDVQGQMFKLHLWHIYWCHLHKTKTYDHDLVTPHKL
jgi:hypothetical protein